MIIRREPIILACLALIFLAYRRSTAAKQTQLSRADFPKGFVFGTASSAYQYEGAAKEGGRGPSIWDTFTDNRSNIVDGSNGDVANDEYHHYKVACTMTTSFDVNVRLIKLFTRKAPGTKVFKIPLVQEDIELMSEMGMESYRFSISWSRLIPEGRGKVNQLGIGYYNNLIDGLLAKGIQPFATLYHFDLPQALQDAYGGWLSPQVVDDFSAFAETCFKEFGDRVKHWITFNEPSAFVLLGYNNGSFPPKRCSKSVGKCASGDSATEPYIAGHNVLLSHAITVDIYRKRYQRKQRGSVGITLSTAWYVPFSSSVEDAMAVQRALDFFIGWYLDPLIFGDYPSSMHMLVGDRLPSFTDAQSSVLKSSVDFIGVNYYSTYFAASYASSNKEEKDFFSDMGCYSTGVRDGVSIGPMAASNWLYIDPSGIYNIVQYLKRTYNNIPMYITENGVDEANNVSLPLKQALDDHKRVRYHKDHLLYLNKAIRAGADVRGYFAWSLLDNFEWLSGYSVRFGLYHVDFSTLKRYPKTSVQWFKDFLRD